MNDDKVVSSSERTKLPEITVAGLLERGRLTKKNGAIYRMTVAENRPVGIYDVPYALPEGMTFSDYLQKIIAPMIGKDILKIWGLQEGPTGELYVEVKERRPKF